MGRLGWIKEYKDVQLSNWVDLDESKSIGNWIKEYKDVQLSNWVDLDESKSIRMYN